MLCFGYVNIMSSERYPKMHSMVILTRQREQRKAKKRWLDNVKFDGKEMDLNLFEAKSNTMYRGGGR